MSDGDIRNTFGLSLLPTLNGSFVSIGHHDQSPHRFIALTNDEVRVFKVSAGDAIPLDVLSPEVANIIRQDSGPANVDLLSPHSVITYLSREAQPPSDEWLADFWCWLEEWRHNTELISLLKNNVALPLIPTTRGPKGLSYPVFKTMQDADNTQLIRKLDLAFVSSVLAPSVVQLLSNQNLLKNASDLNDILGTISLATMPSFTEDEAKSIFAHIVGYHGQLSSDNLGTLRELAIFPVMTPRKEFQPEEMSNCSVTWRSIFRIYVKGITPMRLIPLLDDDVHFLDKASIHDPSCAVLKSLQIQHLKEEDILLHALNHFTSQSKSLQVAFVSYIKHNQHHLPNVVKETLLKTRFLRTGGGILQSPENVIDPNSPLVNLFPQGYEDWRLSKIESNHDRQLVDCLRELGSMKMNLTADLVQERISYISSNSTSPEAIAISYSLLVLMNKPTFPCSGLTFEPDVAWLPTKERLVSPRRCINSGRSDTDLFDDVLITLDESISISPSFKALMNWDKPLPIEIVMKQLRRVLDLPDPESRSHKIRSIIRELGGRQLQDAELQNIKQMVTSRRWIPTKSGILAPHSRAVFTHVAGSSGFYEIDFSMADKEIYQFLSRMGCSEK